MFQVTKDGVASSAGLKAGDGLLEIGDMSTSRFTHEDARGEIIRSGNEVRLVVQRYYTFFLSLFCLFVQSLTYIETKQSMLEHESINLYPCKHV